MLSVTNKLHWSGRCILNLSRGNFSVTSLFCGSPRPSTQNRKDQFVPKSRNKKKARQPSMKRELRLEFAKHKGEIPIINCQRIEYNFYEGMKYGKFQPVPLASQSWSNRKSNGDSFTLYQDYNLSIEDSHFGNVSLNSDIEMNPVINQCKAEEQPEKSDIGFDDLGIHSELCSNVKKMGYQRASDIQVKAIPSVLEGASAVISAHTGCGKTLAYLLPIVQRVLERNREIVHSITPDNSPMAVIITPSRELAEQIHEVLLEVIRGLPVTGRLFVGGFLKGKLANPKYEITDILVGTIGALNKAFAADIFKSDLISHLVLDEADELVDDINRSSVQYILSRLMNLRGPKKNHSHHPIQICLVSATMPRNLQTSFRDILPVDTLVRITTEDLHHVLKSVPQTFLKVGKTNKGKVLLDFVETDHKKGKSILIFRYSMNILCHFISRYSF